MPQVQEESYASQVAPCHAAKTTVSASLLHQVTELEATVGVSLVADLDREWTMQSRRTTT